MNVVDISKDIPFDKRPIGLIDRAIYLIIAAILFIAGLLLISSVGILSSLPPFITSIGLAVVSVIRTRGEYSKDLSAKTAQCMARIPGLAHLYLGRYKTAIVWIVWFTLMATLFGLLLSIGAHSQIKNTKFILVIITLTAFTYYSCLLDSDRVINEIRLDLDNIGIPNTQLANPMMVEWILNTICSVLCIAIVEWRYQSGYVTESARLILIAIFAISAGICACVAYYAKKHKGCSKETTTYLSSGEKKSGFGGIIRLLFVESAAVLHPIAMYMVTVIAMLLMNAGYNDIKALGLLLASSGVYCILMKPIMLRKWDARKKTAALIIAAAMIEALLVWLLLVI